MILICIIVLSKGLSRASPVKAIPNPAGFDLTWLDWKQPVIACTMPNKVHNHWCAPLHWGSRTLSAGGTSPHLLSGAGNLCFQPLWNKTRLFLWCQACSFAWKHPFRGGFMITKTQKPLEHLIVFFHWEDTRGDQVVWNSKITHGSYSKEICFVSWLLKLAYLDEAEKWSTVRRRGCFVRHLVSDVQVPGCQSQPCIHHNLDTEVHKEAREPMPISAATSISQRNKFCPISSSILIKQYHKLKGLN